MRQRSTLTAVACLFVAVGTPRSLAEAVPLDMGAAFNFDAVGTPGEHDFSFYYRYTNVWTDLPHVTSTNASTLWDTMRGVWSVTNSHNVAQYENNGRCFVSQALADRASGTGRIGLPNGYLLGDFELGKGVTPPPDCNRYGRANWAFTSWPDVTNTYPRCVSNALRISRGSAVVNLVPSQQARYSSFNILFGVWRAVGAASYTGRVEALYADAGGAWVSVWEDAKTVAAGTTNAGGSFATGGATAATEGTWEDADGVDTNIFGVFPFVSVRPVAVCTNTRYSTNAGSPGYNSLATGNRFLWAWDSDPNAPGLQGVPLNPNRVLTALRFTATASGGASHRLHLYAISAARVSPARPPGTVISVIGPPTPTGMIWVDGASTSPDPDGSYARPFPTIAAALSTLATGGTIMVRGGTYRESIAVPSGQPDRPTVLTAAPGERVVVSGARPVNGWQPWSNGVYTTVIDWRPQRLFADEKPQPLSREPNDGWWVATAVEELALIDPTNLPFFAGSVSNAEVYVWTQSGNTFYTCPAVSLDRIAARLEIARPSPWLVLTANDKYYVQNQPTLCDRPGEWAVAPEGARYRLYYRPADTAALDRMTASREASRVVLLSGARHVRIEDIGIAGSDADGIYCLNSSNVVIRRCLVHDNHDTGLSVRGSTGLTVERCVLRRNEYGLTFHSSTNAVVQQNDIGGNGTDGLILAWNSDDLLVRRNYVHDHLLWGHPDNIQLYREVARARFVENAVVASGQSVMMQETHDGSFEGNLFLGCGAYMLIFGHNSAGGYAVGGNTLAFPGYGCMSLTENDYAVSNNVFMTGQGSPMYGVSGVTNYTGDRNLFWNSSRVTNPTILVSSGGWHKTLAAFRAATGQDLRSTNADPRFVSAPIAYAVLDAAKLASCTRSNLIVGSGGPSILTNDTVEIDFDRVPRRVRAVAGTALTIDPPLDARPAKTSLVAVWGDRAAIPLDLRLRADSPGATLGADGGPAGARLDLDAFRAGDFDGDGQRDIPALPPCLENP